MFFLKTKVGRDTAMKKISYKILFVLLVAGVWYGHISLSYMETNSNRHKGAAKLFGFSIVENTVHINTKYL